MSTSAFIFWSIATLVGFAGSALYSGMETGTYRLNRIRLQNRAHRGERSATFLRDMIANPPVLLGTLLIGNNIVNFLGTASLTRLFDGWGMTDTQTIIANILIVTPLLFIFGETLPKDMFGAHADRLMYRLAPVLNVSHFVFRWAGLLFVINSFTRVMFRMLGDRRGTAAFHPRRQVEILVKEGVGYGLLTDDQSAIVERVMSLSKRKVEDEMVHWEDVQTISPDADAQSIWSMAERTSRSRFPVVDGDDKVIGILHVMDALRQGRDHCPEVRDIMREALQIKNTLPLRKALRTMQHKHFALAIVMEDGSPVGVVSIKDLVEPITGELASW